MVEEIPSIVRATTGMGGIHRPGGRDGTGLAHAAGNRRAYGNGSLSRWACLVFLADEADCAR